jgi:predicted metalloprotease with PDZ domain
MQPPTRYRVVVRDPHAHLFEVSCTIVDPDPAGQGLRLPTWIPGSYLIREFARQFVRVRAEANGAAVPIVKEAKDLWRAAPCAGPLCVIADVYAFDFSVRTAYLDALRGYFNGPALFLCPEGRADAPCEVELVTARGCAVSRLANCDRRCRPSTPHLGASALTGRTTTTR